MKNIKNILKNNEYLMIIILFIVIILLLIFIPNINNEFVKANKLYISEIMVNNTYTIKDNYNEYSDYIEIHNNYKHNINLKGYHLSDSEYKTNKWTFPDVTINSGEYLIVYASGKDKCDIDKRICHTNFKLNSSGETITLTDNSNTIINRFSYEVTTNDISYGYTGKKYTYLNNATPGYKNTKNKLKVSKLTNKDIYINEYIIHNQRNFYDSSGNYYDYIEIYNNTKQNIKLENIYLSDNSKELNKYKLPNIEIDKESYLLIYLSEESKVNNKEIYANFKLSDNDKTIMITNGKKIIDEVEIVKLNDNISYGRIKEKWYYFTKPTPGYANNTKYHTSLGGQE